MEEREQEKGSSSQNVKTILSVRKRGTHVGIILSDSSSFFILSRDYESLDIQEGKILDESFLEKLILLDEVCQAYEKALELLSFSSSTCFMLKQKLKKRNFSGNAAGEAAAKLAEEGLINDRKYAENWAAVRLGRNPEGLSLLKAGLMSRGVSLDTAEEVLAGMIDNEVLEEALARAAEKISRKKGIDREKTRKKLYAKGFPANLINKYMDNIPQF